MRSGATPPHPRVEPSISNEVQGSESLMVRKDQTTELTNPAVYGGDLDSTLVTNPEVHVVMAANHVNPKLQINSRKRRNVRSGSLRAASSW